jgi:hypothetical protein
MSVNSKNLIYAFLDFQKYGRRKENRLLRVKSKVKFDLCNQATTILRELAEYKLILSNCKTVQNRPTIIYSSDTDNWEIIPLEEALKNCIMWK